MLAADATPAQLIHATAANHRSWFAENARGSAGAHGGAAGARWTVTPQEAVLAFPTLTAATAGEVLDAFLADCRRAGTKTASCWSLEPPRPRDLGARLCARGFEWGWKPHWMALNLSRMREDFPVPDGLRITIEETPEWEVDDLPYYQRPTAPPAPLPSPRRTWHFGAWLDGNIVGHSVLHLTTGRRGVAGLYSVGVVPAAQGRGIGRAISLAPCRFAHSLGCRWATLNAATHIYERLGFASLGWGQTWWMHAPALAAPPPAASQVAFAEAVGRGDIRALNSLGALPDDLDAPLLNGHAPLNLAVRTGKPASAEWLAAHGATLDVLSAWDLGWQDRVPQLLARFPHLADRRSGHSQTTPLHEAVMRGDSELLSLLLTAGPDLSIQDTQFHSTALGWARHLDRTEMAALLEQHLQSTGRETAS